METLHVLVDQLVFGAPEFHAQKEMSPGLAEALNREYREQGISYRWERCGNA